MAVNKRYAVNFRRKREGRTGYKKRLELLKSGLPRLVIRRSNNYITLQVVQYTPAGDTVLAQAESSELKKQKWTFNCKNVPACYLTGLLLASRAKDKVQGDIIVDLGSQFNQKGGRLFAAVKGALDGGLSVRVSEECFPDEERINGNHIVYMNEKQKEIASTFTQLSSSLRG